MRCRPFHNHTQHAMRQAWRLGENLAATIRGEAVRPFRYRNLGALVSLGRYKGVARVVGIRLKGFPAWFLHRTYHLTRVPTLNRKVRVMLDWTVALFFRRDVVQLGSLQHPRQPFSAAVLPEGEPGTLKPPKPRRSSPRTRPGPPGR